eukprot:CAMPEP_0185748400 /NCGR_PEP_ID=MMETSP1174-20130828/7090_1 /TAXON_ID=35687 /ORGANISM="Dictyocha speculum, Strain CCMP1381" /LENGTH=35 /DNA_ID= /DNA_START= /DNA_END= /DNA_ORIENTATION=
MTHVVTHVADALRDVCRTTRTHDSSKGMRGLQRIG